MRVERFEHAGVGYGVRHWGDFSAFGGPHSQDASLLSSSLGGPPSQDVPLVLVHGFAQSAASWDEVAELLARDRTVYALDLVGHGRSDRPDDPHAYALEAQAEALLAFLNAVSDGEDGRRACKPAVVGYSMGGRVALAAAVRDPGAFGALILESAGLGPTTSAERATSAERDATQAARLRADGLSAFMDVWERLPLFASQRDLPTAARKRLRAGRLSNDAEALARTFEGAGQHAMPARTEALTALAVLREGGAPVLYVAGERDAKYRALADSLAASNVCETRIVEGAGHSIHLEAPAAFVACLRACLETRP